MPSAMPGHCTNRYVPSPRQRAAGRGGEIVPKRRGVTQLASGAEGCETGPLRRPEAGRTARTPPQTQAQNTLSTRPPPGQKDRCQVRADGGGRRGLCKPRGTGSAGTRPTAAFSPRPLTPRAPDEVLVLGERCWGRPEEARACCSHPEISSEHAAFDPRSPFPPRAGEREVGRAARLDPAQEGPAGQGEGYRPGT